jgi:predicted secreted protein
MNPFASRGLEENAMKKREIGVPAFSVFVFAAALVGMTGAVAATVDLSSEASRPAANDLARATVFAEAAAASAGESARKVNHLVGEAVAAAKSYAQVKVQNGGTHTYPVYAKGGKIEAWRMRSELLLESGDTAALSELIGKLQANLGVGSVVLVPSPETRRKAESDATLEAIAAFKARAGLVAGALGKPYRIKHLTVGGQAHRPPMPMHRAAPMAAMEAAASMPIEAGESQVTVTVSGQIELSD